MERWKKWRSSKSFVLTLVALGMAAGFLYYLLVGCVSGTCLITSNPVISTLYGGVLGFLVSQIFSVSKKKQP